MNHSNLNPSCGIIAKALSDNHWQMARARFMKLERDAQLRTLESLDLSDALRLATSLPTLSVARLVGDASKSLGRAIVQALPAGKRQTVMVILSHRRSPSRQPLRHAQV